VEWVRTLIDLVALRASAGQPVLRLALILGGVTLLTGLAAVGMPSAPLSKIRGPARMRSNADG
jgi:hypothetical protein